MPVIGEGKDGTPASWTTVLTENEKKGNVDYTIAHHDICGSGLGEERPVVTRGDSYPQLLSV